MDIIKGIRGVANIQKKELGMPVPAWTFINGMWVEAVDRGESYIDKGYKSIPYIYSIISQIVDKASDAPIQVMKVVNQEKANAYKLLTKGSQTEASILKSRVLKAQAYEVVESHPFLDVIKNPNPIDTEKTLKENLLGYLQLTGNAYMYGATPGIGSNASKPTELWAIPSPCVQIITGTRRDPISGYKVSYFTEESLPKEKVMHIKLFNPVTDIDNVNWLYGMSPLRSACRLISQIEAADTATGTLFRNMGPAGILSGNDDPEMLTEEIAIGIQDKFRQQHMGVHNAGDIIVTPSKVTWQQIGVSPVDLKIIEAEQNFLEKLCAIFKYPKELITGSENVASQGWSDKQLVTKAVMPLLRRLDDALTQYIQSAYGDNAIEAVSDLQYYPELAEDRSKQTEWLKNADWLTIDEKRAVQDYEKLESGLGNKVLVASSKASLEDVVEGTPDPDVDLLENEGLI